MNFNVPGIEDLVESTLKSLKNSEEDLEIVKKYNPIDSQVVQDYQRRIDKEKKLLEKFKPEIRDIQLDKLGI